MEKQAVLLHVRVCACAPQGPEAGTTVRVTEKKELP